MPDHVVERAQTHLEEGRSYEGAWMTWRAARSGNWRAQGLMAEIYRRSDSTYLSYHNADWADYWEERMVEAQKSAAEAGDVEAMAQIGYRYLRPDAPQWGGVGYLKQDRTRGIQWLQRAAEMGSGHAHALMALPHFFDRPRTERIELLTQAAELGYPQAHRMMATWIYHPANENEQASVVQYARTLKKGKEAGDNKAGQLLKEFIEGIQKAAHRGNETSQAMLNSLAEADLLKAS
jgi:TPR repeat protein